MTLIDNNGNLDEDTSAGIIELLKRTAHGSGKCVIVVTHSRQLADEADEVLEIRDGKITCFSMGIPVIY